MSSVLFRGYYRPSHTIKYTEESPGGDFDFFSRLVTSWEEAAKIPSEATRQVVVRSGAVLGKVGGAISQMIWPFRLGLGGPIASGHQHFPWIHVANLAGIVTHALQKEGLRGILNGMSPSAVDTTNEDFARVMASVLKRPTFLPLPGFVVKAVSGSERSTMLLDGQRVVPKRTVVAPPSEPVPSEEESSEHEEEESARPALSQVPAEGEEISRETGGSDESEGETSFLDARLRRRDKRLQQLRRRARD